MTIVAACALSLTATLFAQPVARDQATEANNVAVDAAEDQATSRSQQAIAAQKLARADMALERRFHPWGSFPVGAWRRMRMSAETLSEQGEVTATAVTLTRTTLKQATDQQVSLLVLATVEVAGRKFEPEESSVTYGYYGESPAVKTAVTQPLGDGSVKVGAHEIPCQVHQATVTSKDATTSVKTWYSADVAPYMLRRETKVTSLAEGSLLGETVMEVTALETPVMTADGPLPAAEVAITHKHPKGVIYSRAWHNLDIPGGVILQKSREVDLNDQPFRQTEMYLLDYGFGDVVAPGVTASAPAANDDTP